MPTIINNTPACLIPKELFNKEKIQEYWNVLHPHTHQEHLGKDDIGNYFLLYPKPNEGDAMHDICFMYNKLQKKYPQQSHSICINVYDDGFNILACKESDVVYAGHFSFSVKEDVLYHLTNISQQYYENISQVKYYYQQLPHTILRLLNHYYEMKKL